jgi:hypothetical protein
VPLPQFEIQRDLEFGLFHDGRSLLCSASAPQPVPFFTICASPKYRSRLIRVEMRRPLGRPRRQCGPSWHPHRKRRSSPAGNGRWRRRRRVASASVWAPRTVTSTTLVTPSPSLTICRARYLRQVVQHPLERHLVASCLDCGAGGAIAHQDNGVVGAGIPVDADLQLKETSTARLQDTAAGQCHVHVGVGKGEAEHGGHIRPDHTGALGHGDQIIGIATPTVSFTCAPILGRVSVVIIARARSGNARLHAFGGSPGRAHGRFSPVSMGNGEHR